MNLTELLCGNQELDFITKTINLRSCQQGYKLFSSLMPVLGYVWEEGTREGRMEKNLI